tara:strand:+ start:228 stop:1625 length:1398 start_codon:yes stop_codon:yes gene_type:complete
MFNQINHKAHETAKLTQEYEKESLRSRKRFLLNKIEQNAKDMKRFLENKPVAHKPKKLNIDPQMLEEALSAKDLKHHYKPNGYAKISNLLFEPLSVEFTKVFSEMYNKLHNRLMYSGLKTLSISYISMFILTTILTLFTSAAIGVILFYPTVLYSAILCIATTLTVIIILLTYPSYRIKARKREIEKELPFIITHLAATANSGLKDIDLFKSLLQTKYYPFIKFEAKRIVNYITIFGYSFKETLETLQTPSKKFKDFITELANTNNQKHFLNTKSKALITRYQLDKTSLNTYTNIYQELKQTKIKHNITQILAILITITLFVINFYFFYDFTTNTANFLFYILIILAIIIALAPLALNIYNTYQRNIKLETQFLKFTKDLKREKDILKLRNNDYKLLTPYVSKLINQYKIGIPLERALNTFAGDTKNKLIQSVVQISIKNKSNLYDTLDQLTKSKIIRNKLTTEK